MARALTTTEIAAFRARICDAAEPLFAAKGLGGVSMRDLTTAMGVSAMTPYRYFKAKSDILTAIRARGVLRFAHQLEQACAPARDARAWAHAVAGTYLDLAVAQPQGYRLMFATEQPDAHRDPDLSAALTRLHEVLRAPVQALLEAKIVSGGCDELASFFWAAAHGCALLEIGGQITPGAGRRSLMNMIFASAPRPG